MPDAPIFEYHRMRYDFRLFPNRIEVEEKGTFKTKSTVLPIKLVTGATLDGVGGTKVKVTTSDGKSHEFILGDKGKEAYAAILELL